MSHFLLSVLSLLLPVGAAADKGAVVMYGAAWCGPCGAVRSFLEQNRVPFTYVDVDSPDGRKQYEAARGSFSGIPLTVVGAQQIRGVNLESIASALLGGQYAHASTPGYKGNAPYGGHTPDWWQTHFRRLRAHLAHIEQEIARAEKVAFDHHERELVAKLKKGREIVSASIEQLEVDASNVSLPRSYRE